MYKKERVAKVESVRKQMVETMSDFVHNDASETQEYSALLNAKILLARIMNGEDPYIE